MTNKEVGKIFVGKVRSYLDDMGKELAPYEETFESMARVVTYIARQSFLGQNIDKDAAHLNAQMAGFASAVGAISMREMKEMLEEAMKEGLRIIMDVVRLSG